ncbi:MAG: L-rhamnose mutarotase [Actinomycetota bacterium]
MSERVGFVFKLREGSLPEYVRRHDEIWAEMTELLTEAGISDYSIWSYGELLVGTLKADPDWGSVQAVLGASTVQARWAEAMDDLIEWQLDENGQLQMLPEVFRHD